MAKLGIKSRIFLPGPVEPRYGPKKYLTFEGFSVDEKGKQHDLDATVTYIQASLRSIEDIFHASVTFLLHLSSLKYAYYVEYIRTCTSTYTYTFKYTD